MDAKEIYRKLSQPPKSALRPIEAGRLRGKSDINPQWRYEAMTEVFGLCGVGWKYTIDRLWTESGADGEVMAWAQVSVQVKIDGEWSEPIQGIGGKIALLDSEYGSASKYADRFDFDTVSLETKKVQEYIEGITAAGEAGYNVLIIDSMSHAWQQLIEDVEKIAQAKYRGNTWSAWSEGTPMQRDFIEAILSSPCHIIATMRSKTEWQTDTDDRGQYHLPLPVLPAGLFYLPTHICSSFSKKS